MSKTDVCHRGMYSLTQLYLYRIQKMRINAKEHMAQSTQFADPENGFFEVFICPELQTLRCGGIEIIGKQMDNIITKSL